ncbi:MAG: NADH-quinone oxidoreductase subunit G [Myxococcota bacterium]|jgi:NADH-quinone oxidoreductase subunit G
MPTLTIDGQEITVDRGTTILQAAEQIGVEIPTFCYHPGLSIVANCRMCLVNTNKSPKPLPACHAQVMDGMEVTTTSEEVERTRKSVLEFILLNHPVDCPICDQAGECVLQDHYFKYSAEPSRLIHRKRHKAKAKVLGPAVILDAERCILCTRCVRFCDEVAEDSQLEIVNRGEKSEITTFPGMQLDNPYSINTVDICPVGALTSRDFRFRTRVWMLQSERSVCPECARGCTTRIDTFENVPRRYKPAHNPKVNDWWMCDKGRLSVGDYLEGRMEGPTALSDDGRRFATTTQRALEHAASSIQAAGGNNRVAVVVSPWSTNEDAYLVGRLLQGPLEGAQVFLGGRAPGDSDEVLIQADKNPNSLGLSTIFDALEIDFKPLADFRTGDVETVVIFGDNHTVEGDAWGALLSVPRRVVIGAFKNRWWDMATTFLPARLHWEKDGTFTNFEGIVQRIQRAIRAAGTVKSEGFYAMKLAQAFGAPLSFSSPAAIFADLGTHVTEFAGLSHDSLGDHGAQLGSGLVASAPPPVPPETPSQDTVGGA